MNAESPTQRVVQGDIGRRTVPDLRFERKFRVDTMSRQAAESVIKLHPAMFREIYQARTVNNIYFDSHHLQSYWETVEGHCDRTKVRTRWYGDLTSHVLSPMLELKVKSGLTSGKSTYALSPFDLDKALSSNRLYGLLEGSGLSDHTGEALSDLLPTLLNRYDRQYYLSADGSFRVTIDHNMRFRRLGALPMSGYDFSTDRVIVELKYTTDQDGQARQIASRFPFRMTKFSKYAFGIGGDL